MPLSLQPTYISMVQFFWQIYISSVAVGGSTNNNRESSSTSDESPKSAVINDHQSIINNKDIEKNKDSRSLVAKDIDDDKKLKSIFNEIDKDKVVFLKTIFSLDFIFLHIL